MSPRKKQNHGKSPGPSPSFRHVQTRKQPQQHKNTGKTLWRNLFFPLRSTATFLNSLEKRQKCSQQINFADWADPLTAGKSCLWDKKRMLSSISSSIHCQKRHKKHIAMVLTTDKQFHVLFLNLSLQKELWNLCEHWWRGGGVVWAEHAYGDLSARLRQNWSMWAP